MSRIRSMFQTEHKKSPNSSIKVREEMGHAKAQRKRNARISQTISPQTLALGWLRIARAKQGIFAHQGNRLRMHRLELLLVVAVALYAALRFVALAHQSLWTDELFSVFLAKSGVAYALGPGADETNPPLYYLLLELWMLVFGDSESSVRLLSACASVITIVAIYALGSSLFNRRAGLIAALLFALSPWHLFFAQEARACALLNLAFVLSLLSIDRVITRLQRGTAATRVLASLPGIGFLLSAVAAVYLHYVAFPVFATVAIALALIWWREFAFDRNFFLCIMTLGAIAALLSAPALVLAVSHRHSLNLAWMSFPTVTQLSAMVTGTPVWAGKVTAVLSAASAAIWVAIFACGALNHRKHAAFMLTYFLPIAGFGFLVLLSLFQPLLVMRTVLWISIPLYLGVGGAVTTMRDERAGQIAAAAILLTGAVFTYGYFAFTSHKEPWRASVHNYAALISSHDLLILGSDTPATAFVYYQEERLLPQLRRWPGNVTSADRLDERVAGIPPISDSEIADAAQGGVKIWLVSRNCEKPTVVDEANVLLRRCFPPVATTSTRALRLMRHSYEWLQRLANDGIQLR